MGKPHGSPKVDRRLLVPVGVRRQVNPRMYVRLTRGDSEENSQEFCGTGRNLNHRESLAFLRKTPPGEWGTGGGGGESQEGRAEGVGLERGGVRSAEGGGGWSTCTGYLYGNTIYTTFFSM